MKKSCYFIGHREIAQDMLPALMETVEQHITEYGVTDFLLVITEDLIAWRQQR